MQQFDLKNARFEDVKNRFVQIIAEHPQKWWAQKVGVSQSLISSNWTAGKLPRIETLIEILTIKGISPNWFIYGIQPKYLKDAEGFVDDPAIGQKRETHRKMLETERELLELRAKVAHLENALEMQELSQLVSIVKNGRVGKRTVFENHGLPLITFMRLLNDLMFKSFELTVKNEMDDERFGQILSWIVKNFDSEKFKAIAALKGLDNEMPCNQ